MKVICAGMSKTGTKTLNAALTALGYKVYDFFENTEILKDEWEQISKGKARKELLREMYKDVDAACDLPIFCFWEELHEAFPDAKVILSIRDNEDDYVRSMLHQIEENNSRIGIFLKLLSPSYARWENTMTELAEHTFGVGVKRITDLTPHVSPTGIRMSYRRHNAYVKQCCPNEKLLVFNCKEGWEPLCKFLDVPIPDEEFPHKNIKGEVVNDLLKSKTFRKIKKEIAISLTLIVSTVFATFYYAFM